MTWQPLERATGYPLKPEVLAASLAEMRKTDPTMTEEKLYEKLNEGQLWKNDLYTIAVYDQGEDGKGGRFLHLSIKRNDREPIHDWRDLQRIKTELCGPEAEGVEIYPAESRVVDMANQYHLWVFTKAKLGFGFRAGAKMTAEESSKFGSKNRPGA